MEIEEEIKITKQGEAHHRKKMEYFKEELKILEKYKKETQIVIGEEHT